MDGGGISMRVLDIDLDFFLADCCELSPLGERPSLSGHEPWTAEAVERFLEINCGLDPRRPIPGRVFETHDGALRFWAERVEKGELTAPFDVTHVDAHSDLGVGYPGPSAVLDGVLPVQMELRRDLDHYYARHQLDEANYLLFALALRYVRSLENVRNPKSRPDFPAILKDPAEEGTIRLSSFASRLMEAKNGREPAVPYRAYDDYRDFHAAGPYDLMSLAISPRYAPKEADALIPIFRRYMLEV